MRFDRDKTRQAIMEQGNAVVAQVEALTAGQIPNELVPMHLARLANNVDTLAAWYRILIAQEERDALRENS